MARKAFYSFHYQPDCTRAAQVRNMGMVEGNVPVADNSWEEIKKGGDAAIQKWIKEQLNGRSCTIVLVGQATAGRKWISYEIAESWNSGKGVVGVRIHNLKDLAKNQSAAGANPFDYLTLKSNGSKLSSVIKLYNPPSVVSTEVYDYIKKNLADWVEEAIEIRNSNN